MNQSNDAEPTFWPLLLDPAISQAEKADPGLKQFMDHLRLADASIREHKPNSQQIGEAIIRRNTAELTIIRYLSGIGVSRTVLEQE